MLGLAAALWGASLPARALDAFALVAQAMRAKSTATYQARQTIIWNLPIAEGGGMMEIVTASAHRGVCSRLTYLFPPDAAGRVMLDNGTQMSLFEPQKRSLLVGPSVSGKAQADRQAMLGLLRRNYTCTLVRREPLNGRQCIVVAIRPRQGDGPYKLCWIDPARPFVLRLEEYDQNGCRRYVSAYDSISFCRHLPLGALSLPPDARLAARRSVRETLSAALPAAPDSVWKLAGFVGRLPAWLPRGYSLLRLSLLLPAPDGPPLIQIQCSDGLQTLTLTESRAGGAAPPLQELNSALARYGQQAWVMQSGGVRIMVRGELSLPPGVGTDLALALAPGTEPRLARAMTHQFGAASAKQMTGLRRAGWNYVELASAALFLRRHPRQQAAFVALLGKQPSWPFVARRLHANGDALSTQARAWIVSVL